MSVTIFTISHSSLTPSAPVQIAERLAACGRRHGIPFHATLAMRSFTLFRPFLTSVFQAARIQLTPPPACATRLNAETCVHARSTFCWAAFHSEQTEKKKKTSNKKRLRRFVMVKGLWRGNTTRSSASTNMHTLIVPLANWFIGLK